MKVIIKCDAEDCNVSAEYKAVDAKDYVKGVVSLKNRGWWIHKRGCLCPQHGESFTQCRIQRSRDYLLGKRRKDI